MLHPILYRHIYKSAEEKFRRWAQEVWLVQVAEDGIDFLADFIREVDLPTTFTEMGIILDDNTIRAIATSTIITPGCCRQLTPNEIVEILKECKSAIRFLSELRNKTRQFAIFLHFGEFF